jgi:hypothetical protein
MVSRVSRPEPSEVPAELQRRHADLDSKRGRRFQIVGNETIEIASSYTAARAEWEVKPADALARMAVVAAGCESMVRPRPV